MVPVIDPEAVTVTVVAAMVVEWMAAPKGMRRPGKPTPWRLS